MAAALKPITQLKGSAGVDGRVRMRTMRSAMPMLQRRRRQQQQQRRQCVLAASAAGSRSALCDRHDCSANELAVLESNKRGGGNGDRVNYVTQERLDRWIRDSVGEIVSNIGEAPFLMHIFSNGPLLRLEREEALPEKWQCVKKRWDQGTCPPPDGIILVEELKVDEDEEAVESIGTKSGDDEASTKKWGLVVQGKGMDCASCYILNTCRVRSTVGFCTHFCLLRAKCFGEPLETQIRKVWLQQR